MKTFKILFALILTISIFSSCRKDAITTDIEMIPPIPQVNVENTFSGFVTDLDGNAIADATVSVLNNSTTTNELGFFEIRGLANEQFAVLKVEKAGYFDQYETLVPSKTAINRTRIQFVERNLSSSFSSANGGSVVSMDLASRVIFQPNSFIDEDGNPYNGQVNVYTFYIDPTHEDIDQIMPGNLMAVNAQDEVNILQSFGMINVELEGEGGQKIDINKPATIEIDVPQSIQNNAPTEIPLWYFDETTGLWVEEGSASLSNGRYFGEVNHFTFWNCDVPGEFTFVNGQILDSKGISVTRVRITNTDTGAKFTTWTDSEGNFAGGVPQNANLLLEVLGFCGDEILFSTNIGPFNTPTEDLGVFNISNNTNFSLISGTFLDCDQMPLSNGEVYFNLINQSFTQQTTTDADGNFSALVPTCDMEEVQIRAINLADGFVSQPVTVLPSNNIEIGTVNVCTNVSGSLGSVVLEVGGEVKVFDNCTVTMSGSSSFYLQYFEAFPSVSDSIHYTWSLAPTGASWSNFFVYSPPQADMFSYTQYSLKIITGVSSFSITQDATNPGDIMQLQGENIRCVRWFKDPVGGNGVQDVFTDASITINAVLQ